MAKSAFGSSFAQSFQQSLAAAKRAMEEEAAEKRLNERLVVTRAHELQRDFQNDERDRISRMDQEGRDDASKKAQELRLVESEDLRRGKLLTEGAQERKTIREELEQLAIDKDSARIPFTYPINFNSPSWKSQVAQYDATAELRKKQADAGLPMSPFFVERAPESDQSLKLFPDSQSNLQSVEKDIYNPTEKEFADVEAAVRTRVAGVADAASKRLIDQSAAHAAGQERAAIRQHVMTARNLPGHVFDALQSADPAVSAAALLDAQKNIHWTDPTYDKEGRMSSPGAYVYKAKVPKLSLEPGAPPPDSTSGGSFNLAPYLVEKSSYRSLNELPLVMSRRLGAPNPTSELPSPSPLRRAIGAAMGRENMSADQEYEAYNTLGSRAADISGGFQREAVDQLSRQEAALDKAIGRKQADRDEFLKPKRAIIAGRVAPGEIIPRTPSEEISFAEKRKGMEDSLTSDLQASYELARRQRALRGLPANRGQ